MPTLAPAAVLYEAKQPLRIETVRVLPPQKGEVTVRMKAAGVCHSDLHVMKGDLTMPTPIILGHEGAGVIEAVGEGVTSVAVGDPVILVWRGSSGRPALCDMGTAMRFTGLMPDGTTRFQNSAGGAIRHYAGVSAFSSLSTMPEASVVKIPEGFSFEKAALIGCGVITGVGAVERAAKVRHGSTVAVIGCGGIGLNAVQAARMAGARQIIAVDKFARKEADARLFGATDYVDANLGDPVEAIKHLTDGKGVDYAIEAYGSGKTAEQAFDATKKGGMCVMVGITSAADRASINVNQLVYAEKTLRGSLYGSTQPRQDLLLLIGMHQSGRLMLDELITTRYPLEGINDAYDALQRGEVARSLIVFE